MKKHVIIGMSGGVDSSVAAALLVKQGYKVTGITMNLWDKDSMSEFEGYYACFGPNKEEDTAKAAEICDKLGIQFLQFELSKEFSDIVLNNFSYEYSQGRTPNPCVRCNSRVKFGALIDKVTKSGLAFDFFATGHYVRKGYSEFWNSDVLLRGMNLKKDQSYFLYRLTPQQIARTLFPLGGMEKEDVKKLAYEMNLGFDEVRESQDFISGDYTELLDFEFIPGDIVDTEGNVLGQHNGFVRYTIGQRRGLGIAAPRPYYVVGIDKEKNQVIIGHKEHVYGHSLQAGDMNWLVNPQLGLIGDSTQSDSDGRNFFEAQAKIRSQQKPFSVRVYPESVGNAADNGRRCRIEFIEPQWAVTPGQSVVLYDGDIVLGGGIIE